MTHTHAFFLQVICPIYNEERSIESFLRSLYHFLEKEITKNVEIVCIDDGSTDQTRAIISQLYQDTSLPISLLSFSRNFGKEAAITAGLDYCCHKGDAVVIIDTDSQHPFETIKTFVEKWQEGYAMVYGIQQSRHKEGFLRRSFAKIFYRILNLIATVPIPRHAGDFRLLDKSVVQAIKQCQERSRFMKGLYAWAGGKSLGILYTANERISGQSHYNLARLFSLALIGIVSFSSFPLYLIAYAGILISSLSVLYGTYIVASTLFFGEKVPGYATLITVILFLGGVQIFCMGVLGLYVGKIFEEVKQRPNYIIYDQLVKKNA